MIQTFVQPHYILSGRDKFEHLLNQASFPAISLYLPMVEKGRDTQENVIRFTNAVNRLEKQLEEHRLFTAEMREVFEETRQFQADQAFWQHQDQGLAVFISKGFLSLFRMSIPCPDVEIISDQFHIKPLLQLYAENGRYFVLSLSQKNVALYEATQFSIKDRTIPNMPGSMREYFGNTEFEQSIQPMSVASPGGNGTNAMYHGQSSIKDELKAELQQYFRAIDKALQPFLAREHAPLLLAGVEYYAPLYRSVSSYRYIMDEVLHGNVDMVSQQAIHERSWKILGPFFRKRVSDARDQAEEMRASGLFSEDIEYIVKCSGFGAVALLFVSLEAVRWGKVDPVTKTVEMHEQYRLGDTCLLDYAARQTLLTDGTIYVVPTEEVPDHRPAAALLRYGMPL